MKKKILSTFVATIMSVPLLVGAKGTGAGASAPAGHTSAVSSQPPITSSQPPITSSQPPITTSQPPSLTSGSPGGSSMPSAAEPQPGVPIGALQTGAPREYYTTNAQGQVVVALMPQPREMGAAPPPSGPPVEPGQPSLPYGAANQASAQIQFQAEIDRVNQMEGHAPQNQFASTTESAQSP